jgi:hypothetical protein
MLALERLRSDRRAVEGLPVRLVIAFVVGVASLSVMLNLVSGVGGLAVSELDVKPTPEVVSPGDRTVEVTVVDPGGDPVGGATVVARSGTARIDGVETAETDTDGSAELSVSPALAPNQVEGTLELSVKPPAGTQYVDRRANTAVLVLRE